MCRDAGRGDREAIRRQAALPVGGVPDKVIVPFPLSVYVSHAGNAEVVKVGRGKPVVFTVKLLACPTTQLVAALGAERQGLFHDKRNVCVVFSPRCWSP